MRHGDTEHPQRTSCLWASVPIGDPNKKSWVANSRYWEHPGKNKQKHLQMKRICDGRGEVASGGGPHIQLSAFIMKNSSPSKANLVLAVLSFTVMHSPCLQALGQCQDRPVLASDSGLSRAPRGRGSAPWRAPSALQTPWGTSQGFTNDGGLLETSFLLTSALAWPAGRQHCRLLFFCPVLGTFV